ncbi:hypothetical protein [Paenibacillus sp. OAS669]|uniref:hypothetical protein n=1 Tax=Paenibacillus sp. OAS669 TaxID=2663821 RepID=UPI00178B80C5|nr:hypothetical protein [Paenibacillus sp. OAS669]MBE1444223.1 hypothetical protein [Paenibacillus sp. OAS669]
MNKYQRLINDLNNDLESNNETLTIHFWSTDAFLEKMDPAQAEDWKEQFILNIIQKDKT